MSPKVEWSTPDGTMAPVGPYSHITKVGQFITIGGTAGVDPAPGVASQARQILDAFEIMLATVGSSLDHVIHINVFLADMQDFDRMNDAYVEKMGKRRPARTTIAVSGLPKPGAVLTMNLTAVTKPMD